MTRKQIKTTKPEPAEIVYRCTCPGCDHQTTYGGKGSVRHQHVSDRGVYAYVEMRRVVAVPHSRTDSFAGNGRAINQYQE